MALENGKNQNARSILIAALAKKNEPTATEPNAPARKGGPLRALVKLAFFVLVVVAIAAALVVFRPAFAEPLFNMLGMPAPAAPSDASPRAPESSLSTQQDTALSGSELDDYNAHQKYIAQTPLVASCQGLDLHSPIRPIDLTGVLFHQAATKWGLVMTTQLPEADYETVAASRSLRINHDQVGGGEWLDADAIHLWRTADDTDMDTSIDVGALAGTTVVAPVDGTVILIRDYKLYDEVDDIEIHISPDGHPELDVVLIHTQDPTVKAGDRVEAGVTPISHVRDIEKDLTDVQLGFFTPEGVGGNHTHLQVNDINYPNYKEARLTGAIDPATVKH